MIFGNSLMMGGRFHEPAETLTFLQATQDTVSRLTYTFAGQNFGAAHAGRRIIACASYVVSGVESPFGAVTVGGITATKIVEAYNYTTNTLTSAIFIADVPHGATGDVVVNVTGSTNANGCHLHLYALDSIKTNIIPGSDNTTPFTFASSFAVGDFYLGIGRCLSTTTHTWTNATGDSVLTHSGVTRTATASRKFTSAGSVTVRFTPTNTSGAHLASVRIE